MNCIPDRCRDLLVTNYLRLPEQGAMVIKVICVGHLPRLKGLVMEQ